jgi:hypothetical protein
MPWLGLSGRTITDINTAHDTLDEDWRPGQLNLVVLLELLQNERQVHVVGDDELGEAATGLRLERRSAASQ